MKRPKHSFDPECGKLAEHFLADHPLGTRDRINDLAEHIQAEIESWIRIEEEYFAKKEEV